MQQNEDIRETSAPPRRPVALIWVGFWLALILVGAKALLLGPPSDWGWAVRLTVVSFRDVIFALSFGAIGEAIAWLLRGGCGSRPRCAVWSWREALCVRCMRWSRMAFSWRWSAR